MLCYILSVAIILSSFTESSLSLHSKEKCKNNNTAFLCLSIFCGDILFYIRSNISSHNIIEDREKVDIKVFYESLCSGCRHEFSRDLVPLVNHLNDYVHLQLYPFGNAKTLSTNKFQCQHGPAECYGNKLHACAIFKMNMTLAVSYIACMMTEAQLAKKSPDEAAIICAKSRNIDSTPIRQCAMGDMGNMLHLEAGLVSSAVKLKFVPFVLVNGKPVTGDLADAVCSIFYTQALPPPPACLWRRRSGLL